MPIPIRLAMLLLPAFSGVVDVTRQSVYAQHRSLGQAERLIHHWRFHESTRRSLMLVGGFWQRLFRSTLCSNSRTCGSDRPGNDAVPEQTTMFTSTPGAVQTIGVEQFFEPRYALVFIYRLINRQVVHGSLSRLMKCHLLPYNLPIFIFGDCMSFKYCDSLLTSNIYRLILILRAQTKRQQFANNYLLL